MHRLNPPSRVILRFVFHERVYHLGKVVRFGCAFSLAQSANEYFGGLLEGGLEGAFG